MSEELGIDNLPVEEYKKLSSLAIEFLDKTITHYNNHKSIGCNHCLYLETFFQEHLDDFVEIGLARKK